VLLGLQFFHEKQHNGSNIGDVMAYVLKFFEIKDRCVPFIMIPPRNAFGKAFRKWKNRESGTSFPLLASVFPCSEIMVHFPEQGVLANHSCGIT
jgi:hypothetical protein